MSDNSAPGLKRRPRENGMAYYWVAPTKAVRNGYRPKSVVLDPNASDGERAARCRVLQDDLIAWRNGTAHTATKFTFSWLINRYRTDPLSPYHGVKAKTRDDYDLMCNIIEKAIGKLRMDPRLEGGVFQPRIIGHDVRKWHNECGRPDADGRMTAPSRARHMIAVLRILSSYAVEIAVPGAKDFRALLSVVRIPSGQPRQSAPSRPQVLAIVKAAMDMGHRSIAITTLAQFELTERRIHIIGEWEGPQWRPGWVWQNISDWVITYHQTKTRRIERTFDLRTMPALLDMLQAIPEDQHVGAIIKCETTGLPWHNRHYIETFRKVARVAGIPDDIYSMDMRAGGATEAAKTSGVSMPDIQAAGGWADSKMASRYTRDGVGRAQKVVQLRQKNAVGTD